MKHHEFWPARPFETPGYIYLAWRCLRHWITPLSLFKANYGLTHGGWSFESKYQMQEQLVPDLHPKSAWLRVEDSLDTKVKKIKLLAQEVGYPIIIKPDYGFVGKGVIRIDKEAEIQDRLKKVIIDYIAQEYLDLPEEFGVFYLRYKGRDWVSGINQKHFPTIIGDGERTIQELAHDHERHTHYWQSYLDYNDVTEILKKGEVRRISFIGSHTMGCKFTDDTHLNTPAIEATLREWFADSPGFNYGRLDVRAKSVEAFQRGEFKLIEINTIASLPTNMFDPKDSVWTSYAILFDHFYWLAKIAAEHRNKTMKRWSVWKILKATRKTVVDINRQQALLE